MFYFLFLFCFVFYFVCFILFVCLFVFCLCFLCYFVFLFCFLVFVLFYLFVLKKHAFWYYSLQILTKSWSSRHRILEKLAPKTSIFEHKSVLISQDLTFENLYGTYQIKKVQCPSRKSSLNLAISLKAQKKVYMGDL